MQKRFAHAESRLETRKCLVEDRLQIWGPTAMVVASDTSLSQMNLDVAMVMAFGAQAARGSDIDHLDCE
jgi:hypothetical protein